MIRSSSKSKSAAAISNDKSILWASSDHCRLVTLSAESYRVTRHRVIECGVVCGACLPNNDSRSLNLGMSLLVSAGGDGAGKVMGDSGPWVSQAGILVGPALQPSYPARRQRAIYNGSSSRGRARHTLYAITARTAIKVRNWTSRAVSDSRQLMGCG